MFTVLQAYLRAKLKLALNKGVSKSYGHQGEDAVLQAMLKWVKKGVYVDVGAYHPTLYSNTYAFYKKGWRGLVIDPNVDMQPLYALIRPRDTFMHVAVSAMPEEKKYYMFEDGAYNTFDEQRAKEWQELRNLNLKDVRTVSFKPLSQIVHEQNIEHIDFLNIDVEGMDFEVLKTHDFSIPTRVIAIEDETFNPDKPHENQIYTYLHGKGYDLSGLVGLTLLFRKQKDSNV
ncbi:FkbM family methyltransferase [bacterium]|nr:MAG: FkbM family methyltransferase [bacterium]